MPTISDEFDCRQEPNNDEDRYAVAIYGDTKSSDVLGHLPIYIVVRRKDKRTEARKCLCCTQPHN